MGAIASGGVELVNLRMVRQLGLSTQDVARVVEREQQELERRERAYRDGRPAVDLRGRSVIVVDDGLATGASMQAAVMALRRRQPRAIVAAVPVAPAETCDDLGRIADECVCLHTPENFLGVGQWYARFDQTDDEEVRVLLAEACAQRKMPLGIRARAGATLRAS